MTCYSARKERQYYRDRYRKGREVTPPPDLAKESFNGRDSRGANTEALPGAESGEGTSGDINHANKDSGSD